MTANDSNQTTTNVTLNKLQKNEVDNLPERLERWFKLKLPEAEKVEVINFNRPSKAAGMSGDTYILSLHWTEKHSSKLHKKKYAIRAEFGAANCPESNFENMVKLQQCLGNETNLAIPKVFDFEMDTSVLGGPFYAMEFIEGKVAPDSPPHTTAGWFFEATARQRTQMYRSGMDFLIDLHKVKWQPLNLNYLLHKGSETTETERHLNHLITIYDDAMEGKRSELVDATINWLHKNKPHEEILCISWGDSRPANMLWRDFKFAAALDWEMCGLGSPCLDVALWYLSDLAFTHGLGIEPLDGMFSREDFINYYEQKSGSTLVNYDFYEVFAAFRMNAIITSMVKTWERQGQHFFGPGISVENTPHALAFQKIAEKIV